MKSGEQVNVKDPRIVQVAGNPDSGSTGVVECNCAKKRRISKRLSSSQITPEFREYTLDNFSLVRRPERVIEAYETVADYLANFEEIKFTSENGIMLTGHSGGGKTHLLIAVCNALLDREYSVLYAPWVELLTELRAAMQSGSDDYRRKVDAMKQADVLYIDDLFKGREVTADGKNPITPFMKEIVFEVVNYRAQNRKPTLVSSEFNIGQLLAVDEAIGGRLYKQCKHHKVHFDLTEQDKATGFTSHDFNYRLVGD